MTILAVGAHPDDIEFGCGGLLLAHVAMGERVVMLVMTEGQRGSGGDPTPRDESMVSTRHAEQRAAADALGVELIWGGLMDCDVHFTHENVDLVGSVIEEVNPVLILTHWSGDSHQDHKAVAAIVTAAARRHPNVLHFSGPANVGFNPTMFVDITEQIDAKVEAIQLHASQIGTSPMLEPESLRAIARNFGISARVPYAEAFLPLRLLLPQVQFDSLVREGSPLAGPGLPRS
ncbi:MAG: PIG-L deacetylase family protein [Candidatus Nanopelagicales bacterium]